MMDTAIVMQAAQYCNYLIQGNLVGLLGNASPTRQPTANVFTTKDGQVQVSALGQLQVGKLFAALGKSREFESAECHTPKARFKNTEFVSKLLDEALIKQTTKFWMKNLASAGIPVAEVRELHEVVRDPQFEHRGVFETLDSPVDPESSITVVKAGYITEEDGPLVRSGPPTLGEHNSEILLSLGYSESDIQNFRENNVIS